ncbi:hypothetical protein ACVWZV_001135 [Bradyrhizobium sp. GM5.1]
MISSKHPAFAKLAIKLHRAKQELGEIDQFDSMKGSDRPVNDWDPIRQTSAKTVDYLCAKSNACTTGLCSCRLYPDRGPTHPHCRAAQVRLEERLGTLCHGSAHFVRTAVAPQLQVSVILPVSSSTKSTERILAADRRETSGLLVHE